MLLDPVDAQPQRHGVAADNLGAQEMPGDEVLDDRHGRNGDADCRRSDVEPAAAGSLGHRQGDAAAEQEPEIADLVAAGHGDGEPGDTKNGGSKHTHGRATARAKRHRWDALVRHHGLGAGATIGGYGPVATWASAPGRSSWLRRRAHNRLVAAKAEAKGTARLHRRWRHGCPAAAGEYAGGGKPAGGGMATASHAGQGSVGLGNTGGAWQSPGSCAAKTGWARGRVASGTP